MRKLGLVVGAIGLMLAGSVFAESYTVQSAVKGDACTMTATTTTMTDPNGNKIDGVLFQAKHDDGDRLDVHCKDVVLKLGMGMNQVFVGGMSAADIKGCTFHEHDKAAGMDGETHVKTSAKFSKAN